jgi:uncharacterized membrane protein
MKLPRMLRHLFSSRLRVRALFSKAVLAQIQSACASACAQHAGEIRFVIETALPLAALWRGLSPRARATQLFAHLHLWDTHHSNGVLIYVLWADRAVEIVADRGISKHVRREEWEAVCRAVEAHYREGRYLDGSLAGVQGVAQLLIRHFPAGVPERAGAPGAGSAAGASGAGPAQAGGTAGVTDSASDLPNQPVLL